MNADYVKHCPVCGSEEAAEENQCQHCGTLLLGVDLTLKAAPPETAAPPAAAATDLAAVAA